MWEVTLRLPSWLLTFFSISRGLYLCLKLRLHAYFESEERNQLILQTSFFRQALGRSDLAKNRVETRQLVIIYFWPNLEHREQQGIVHIPVEVILDTTAPNTNTPKPKTKQDSPPDYQTVSPPPPPRLGRYHEASARNSTPSKTSEDTEVPRELQTDEHIQWEIDRAIYRVQHSIDQDQQGFTYWDLWQIDLAHHRYNPHLYTLKVGLTASSSLHQFPADVSLAEKEEVEEQEQETHLRTESPLPIQVEWRDQMMLNKQGEMLSSQQPSGNLADSGTREVLWTPNSNNIPTREEWNQWIEHHLQETFQEPSTPDHSD